MSLAKHDPKLATAGLAAATVLVFGATAAFAAGPDRTAPKGRTGGDQFSHSSAAYAGTSAGDGGTGTSSGPGYGLGPHGDQTVKDAAGQWVEKVWQTGEVDAVGDGEVKVTDVTSLTWEWTASSTAQVTAGGAASSSLGAVRVGDEVTVEGTQSGTVHTATVVTDHGTARSQ